MLAFVARAMRQGLAKLGEPSLLGGVSCGKVAVSRKARLDPGMLSTADDNYVGRYDTALIDVAYAPKVGNVLDHPDGRFALDRLVHDNGVTRLFIIVPTT